MVFVVFTISKVVQVITPSTFMLQALVDAPDMVRTQMNLKRLSLTDIKIDIKRVPKKKNLVEAMEAAGEC